MKLSFFRAYIPTHTFFIKINKKKNQEKEKKKQKNYKKNLQFHFQKLVMNSYFLNDN